MSDRMNSLAYKLLGIVEKYTKTDMVYVIKGSATLTISQVVMSGSAFVLSILFARYLSQDAFGSYKYVLSIAATLGAFTLTGLASSVTNAVARGKDATLTFAFRESLLWSLPVVGAALACGAYYLYKGNAALAISMAIIAVTTPFINSGSLYGAFLSGKKDFTSLAFYSCTVAIFSSAVIAVTILLTNNYVYAVLAYFSANAIGNLVSYVYLIRSRQMNDEHDPEARSYSRHVTLINLLNIFTSQLDKILLFHYLGPANLAIYSFALAMPDQIKGLLGNVSRIAYPKFAQRSIAEIKKTLLPKMAKYAVLICFITGAYIIAAPYLFKYLFPTYLSSVRYSQIIAATLVTIVGYFPLAALQAHASKRELYIHTAVLNISRISFMLIGIPLYGLMGAIIANAAGRIVAMIVPIVLLVRHPEAIDQK